MSIRNATHAPNGLIECEYKHPKYGWIPYTANPDDVEESGRAIYAQAIAGPVAPKPAKTADQIAREESAYQALVNAGAAKADAKLATLAGMTPAQVRAWVTANVSNLADAKDVLGTLAVAVSVMARRL